MPTYPSPETWKHANQRQAARAARSFSELRKRSAPVYHGPLFVQDDEEVNVQEPREVARRMLVLWAVELRAEGIPKAEALGLVDRHDLWKSVSPAERQFLEDDAQDPDECQRLIWRLESIWVLLWALGSIETLDWPSGMCDVPHLVEMMEPYEADPESVNRVRLRPISELLDAQDLIMRVHWAIRNDYLNGRLLPEDLDWSGESEYVPATYCAAVGVVEQRHYTLNWLVRFLDPEDWDHVDTPT